MYEHFDQNKNKNYTYTNWTIVKKIQTFLQIKKNGMKVILWNDAFIIKISLALACAKLCGMTSDTWKHMMRSEIFPTFQCTVMIKLFLAL